MCWGETDERKRERKGWFIMFPRRKKKEGRQRALSKPRSGRIICKNGILSTLTSGQGDMGECVHVRTPSPLLLEHIRRGNNNCDSLYGVLDEWNSAVEIKLQRRTPLAAKSHPLDVGQWFNYSVARHFDAGPRTSLSLFLSHRNALRVCWSANFYPRIRGPFEILISSKGGEEKGCLVVFW